MTEYSDDYVLKCAVDILMYAFGNRTNAFDPCWIHVVESCPLEQFERTASNYECPKLLLRMYLSCSDDLFSFRIARMLASTCKQFDELGGELRYLSTLGLATSDKNVYERWKGLHNDV